MLLTRLLLNLVFVAASVLTVEAAGTITDGQAMVIFRSGVELDQCRQVLRAHHAAFEHHFPLVSRYQGREMGLVRGTNSTTRQLLADLQRDPLIEHAELDLLRFPLGTQPTDPLLGQQWGLDKIQALDAWALRRGEQTVAPVVVAVIDTGVLIHHPDLASVLWTNPGEIPGNGIDDDQNGYVDDHYSYDFVYRQGDPEPVGDHGTHVAGIAAGAVNNTTGIAGVAYGARVMGLKVADNTEAILTSAVVEAIEYVVSMKKRGANVRVINASYGGASSSSVEREAIQAAGRAGIILCAAAGNSNEELDTVPTYPASYRLTNMIVVAASDQNDNLAGFSNYGRQTVDLAAPGQQVLSTIAGLTGWVAQAQATISGNPLEYSGKSASLTGIIYDCGLGSPGEFPAAVRGNIALISRGTLTFAEKVGNSMAAGARAVIIYNNTSGSFNGTLGEARDWIPALGIVQASGLALKQWAPTPGQVAVISAHERYGFLSGTSMASPHVAGAIAFAAMQFPGDTVGQRIRRVLDSVDKIPGLSGTTITGGRLNLKRMVDTDNDNLPDWWEIAFFGSLSATPQGDPDGDGMSNSQEFAADTLPDNKQSVLRFTRIQVAEGKTTVEWLGGTGARQVLQRAALPGGPWVDMLTNEPPTTYQTAIQDLTGSADYFFRLRVERP